MELQIQQPQQFSFAKMEADIQEIKLGLLEDLKTKNPEAYRSFLIEINGVENKK